MANKPKGPTIKTPSGRTPSGYMPQPGDDFVTQLRGYFDAVQQTQADLNSLLNQNHITYEDVSGLGRVFYDTQTGKRMANVDPTVAAKIAELERQQQFYTDSINRLQIGQKLGLDQSGDPAAQAYLQSQLGQADEQRKEYTDFQNRINDIVALNDVPVAQQMKAAQALSAINAANKERQSKFSPLATFQASPDTDTAPFAAAIKSTLPTSAPPMPQVNLGIFSQAFPEPPNPAQGLYNRVTGAVSGLFGNTGQPDTTPIQPPPGMNTENNQLSPMAGSVPMPSGGGVPMPLPEQAAAKVKSLFSGF